MKLEGKLILAATILASGMAFLDGTVVNIAIPSIQHKFDASLTQIEWMINGYALMLASLILISGSFGDRFGRKRIFLYGIGLFIVSSLLCSLSQSINQLIAFRILQGLGAAMMIPGSLSIIDVSFESSVRGKAIGLWSGFAGGIAAIGPFIGGWLVQTFGWPSIFYINIPIGILALFLTLRYVPETKNDEAQRIDWVGTGLIFLSLFMISYSLIEAPAVGWTNLMIGLLVGGLVMFALFVWTEMKVKEPLMPTHIFTSPLVSGANIVTLFLYFALSGFIFFFVLNLQQVQHYSPIIAGMSVLPSILLITFLSGPAGSLSDKIGPRLPMIVGPLIVAAGMAYLALSGRNANYVVSYLPGLILFGLGMSLVIAPLTKSALSVDKRYSGAASGVNNAVSRIAALLAVALLGAIVLSLFSSNLTKSLASSQLSQVERQQILEQKNKLGGIEIPKTFHANTKQQAEQIIEASFIDGFRLAMYINASLALLSAIVAFFTIRNVQALRKK